MNFSKDDIKAMVRDLARRNGWRIEWDRVRKTPERWKLIREIYEAVGPSIVSGETRGKYLVDWEFTPIEYDMWCSIRLLGLPMWPQYPVGRYFVDFGDPIRKIAFECDGRQWHQADKDAKRDAELLELGWTVYRFPGWQCVRGEDDEDSAHQRLIDIARSHYPPSRSDEDD